MCVRLLLDPWKLNPVQDIQDVRTSFDTLSKSKMLPLLMENFLGKFIFG